jgi:hypothetical protein
MEKIADKVAKKKVLESELEQVSNDIITAVEEIQHIGDKNESKPKKFATITPIRQYQQAADDLMVAEVGFQE